MSKDHTLTPELIAALTPGPDAPAEPYYAIMLVDDQGNTTGQVWTLKNRIMLFKFSEDAEQVLLALAKNEPHHKYALRGVTATHLKVLKMISKKTGVPLYKINGFSQNGQIEAVPL